MSGARSGRVEWSRVQLLLEHALGKEITYIIDLRAVFQLRIQRIDNSIPIEAQATPATQRDVCKDSKRFGAVVDNVRFQPTPSMS
jgi:hypothetical protein